MPKAAREQVQATSGHLYNSAPHFQTEHGHPTLLSDLLVKKVRVLFINQNSAVTFEDLTVTRAKTTPGPQVGDVFGGGIKTYKADVTLRSVAVTNSASGYGGGIFVQAGSLVLVAGTRVTVNKAIYGRFNIEAYGGEGGGIFVIDNGVVTLEAGSSVTGNSAINQNRPEFARGGGISSSGPLTLKPGSTVTGNTLENCRPDNGSCV